MVRPGKQVADDAVVSDEVLSASDTMGHLIHNLEKRLETCNSVYNLATNVSVVRDKERESAENTLRETLSALDARVTAIETALDSIPRAVKRAVEREFARQNTEGKVQELHTSMVTAVEARIAELESAILQRNQLHSKSLKSAKRELSAIEATPYDHGPVSALALAVADLAQKQTSLSQLLDSLQTAPFAPR
jgi:DNA repair exonuclease SbcCD ATPase subunit